MQRFTLIILSLILLLPACSPTKGRQQPCGTNVSRLRNKAKIKEQIKSPYKTGKVYKLSSGGKGKHTFMW